MSHLGPTERARALELATAIHIGMLCLAQQLGLKLEDRSVGGCHIYLAEAGPNPVWNLNISIQFDTSAPSAADALREGGSPPPGNKPNVAASLSLQYARKQVYYLQYDGRHDHWVLEAETDSDDAENWDKELPFRKNIKTGEAIDPKALHEQWREIVQHVISFYLKRSESVYPQRMRSLPPPPSLPPGEVTLPAPL